MTDIAATRQCPYCKEDIKSEAIKCKHCGSGLAPIMLEHGGICPYCKEMIHEDAAKCKHCKSMLNRSVEDDCGCSGAVSNSERAQISNVYSPIQNTDTPIEVSMQPASIQRFYNFPLIFCRQKCIEWSDLFPNICNRWVWECTFGPIIIIWGAAEVAER